MGFLDSAVSFLFLVHVINGKITFEENQEQFSSKIEMATPETFLRSLADSGSFVFTGLGRDYAKAIRNLRRSSLTCLKEALEIELEDESKRFTIARDSGTDVNPFPACVNEDIETITEYFDEVDQFVMKMLKNQFNTSLDIFYKNNTYQLENLPTKSQLHVYQKDSKVSNSDSSLSLPFHTDNGLYLLLTPSDFLPLRTINRNGTISDLYSKDDSLIFLAGSGLTSWLLPEDDLYATPHAVPSLTNSISNAQTRTVFARMKIAPLEATNRHSEQTFGQHFYSSIAGPSTSPINIREERHQVRMRRQLSGGHSQHWPGESSSSSCSKEGIYLTWFNGEPIEEETRSGGTQSWCAEKCNRNAACDAWTLNTNNGWCGLKRSNQVKEQKNKGFVSGYKNCKI
eukprot:GFUD01009714.1.p1 GENE.GFUD01009714.1~~GFUD01009714.1.p1  ORF type:complete len:399 (+),score=86.53 GFUD01009714.1:162-1358(+)